MDRPDYPSTDAQRVKEPRPPAHDVDAAPAERAPARFVDPYELQTETPDEPGYGHGV